MHYMWGSCLILLGCMSVVLAAPGVCGPAHGSDIPYPTIPPTAQLCTAGTYEFRRNRGQDLYWFCRATASVGANATCQATWAQSLQGRCGKFRNQTFYETNTITTNNNAYGDLCVYGTPSTVNLVGTQFQWTCAGTGNGPSMRCVAQLQNSFSCGGRPLDSTWTETVTTNRAVTSYDCAYGAGTRTILRATTLGLKCVLAGSSSRSIRSCFCTGYHPVCGASGRSYTQGSCEAACNDDTVECEGTCPCKEEPTPEPTGCPCLGYHPVCGASGNTYTRGECEAACYGDTVLCQGPCPCATIEPTIDPTPPPTPPPTASPTTPPTTPPTSAPTIPPTAAPTIPPTSVATKAVVQSVVSVIETPSGTCSARPAISTLSFMSDWEADPVKGGYNGVQKKRANGIYYAPSVKSARGFGTAYIEVQPGDIPPNVGTSGERAEVTDPKNANSAIIREDLNSGTVYYGLCYYFPPGFNADSHGDGKFAVIFQLHGPDYNPAPAFGLSPSFALRVGSASGGADYNNGGQGFQIRGQAGIVNQTDAGAWSAAYDREPMVFGRWVEFILQITFKLDTDDGSVYLHRRNEGEKNFRLAASRTGINTLQKPYGFNFEPHYWKQGLYRNNDTDTDSFWMGPMVRAGSFADAELAAFGTNYGTTPQAPDAGDTFL